MTTSQSRAPRGIPAGGQFLAENRDPSTVTLDATTSFGIAPLEPLTATQKSYTKGMWDIEDAVSEQLDSPNSMLVRTTFHIGGRADVRARNLAAVQQYPTVSEEVIEKVGTEHYGKPVTVLVATDSGNIVALEGKGHGGYILAKGARTTGWNLEKFHAVVDVEPGYNKQQVLADRWAEHKAATTPRTEKITGQSFTDLPVYDFDSGEEPPSDIAAVYLLNHPSYSDGENVGSMFLATDFQPSDESYRQGIVNGYFYSADPSKGYSEHGSVYVSDLEQWGGKLTDYQPGTVDFGECLREFEDLSPAEAYRRVMGA